jgi:hypothetical protein
MNDLFDRKIGKNKKLNGQKKKHLVAVCMKSTIY